MRAKLLVSLFFLGSVVLTVTLADDPPSQPPEGWKEYTPSTKVFSVWLPNGGKRSERTRDIAFGTAKLKLSLVQQENDKGTFTAGQVALPVAKGKKIDSNTAIEAFRDGFLKHDGGKVTSESDIKLGKMSGKEYKIEMEKDQYATLRLYHAGPRIYQVSFIGTKEQVENESTKLFLDSFKHQGMVKDEELQKAKDKDKDKDK